jgi:DNA-binding NarL/FixJ family response regulator
LYEHPAVVPPDDTIAPELTVATERVTELEARLRAIGREIEASGIVRLGTGVQPLARSPGLEDLTSRQVEIVSRLMRGERVPTIARVLHLSQKTVRTHLSNVFRKVGVRSQSELLEILRRDV